eukprot:Trichotokara_eunicae@DN5386_c0_g1_i1.p1
MNIIFLLCAVRYSHQYLGRQNNTSHLNDLVAHLYSAGVEEVLSGAAERSNYVMSTLVGGVLDNFSSLSEQERSVFGNVLYIFRRWEDQGLFSGIQHRSRVHRLFDHLYEQFQVDCVDSAPLKRLEERTKRPR